MPLSSAEWFGSCHAILCEMHGCLIAQSHRRANAAECFNCSRASLGKMQFSMAVSSLRHLGVFCDAESSNFGRACACQNMLMHACMGQDAGHAFPLVGGSIQPCLCTMHLLITGLSSGRLMSWMSVMDVSVHECVPHSACMNITIVGTLAVLPGNTFS